MKHSIEAHDVRLPAGARGVVMAAYANGEALEVEFEWPAHAVLTLSAEALEAEEQ